MTDLRLPIGLFFLLIGGILVGLGAFHPDLRAPLTDGNVNLYAGLCMFIFGGAMLWLGKHKPS